MPPKKAVEVVADEEDDQYATKESNTSKGQSKGAQAKTSNPHRNVGGTAKDGGLSTADTVADGGEDEPEDDPDFKPS